MPTHLFRIRKAGGEELAEEGLEGGVGGDELVVGRGVVGFFADVFKEILEGGLVFVGDEIWFGDDGGAVLEIDEALGTVELETDFLGIHEMEEGNVVLAVAEVLEGFGEFLGFGEEIGEDDDEGALADFFRDGVEGGDEAGGTGWFDLLDGGEKPFEMRGAAGGRDFEVELVRADGEAGGIALVDEKVGEGCGDFPGVFDFRFLAGALEIHGARGIDDEVGAEVGIGLEFLDVETIGAGEGLPVEAARIVSGNVFPILCELDGGTTVRGAVFSCDVAHHRDA